MIARGSPVGKKKIVWKRFIPYVIIVGLGTYILSSPERYKILNEIKIAMDSSIIIFFIWFLSVTLGILYYFVVLSKREESSNLVFNVGFGPAMDSTFTGVSYATLIQTSFTILKCSFNQLCFHELHFLGIGLVELIIFTIVMGYILYWTSMRLFKIGYDIFTERDVGKVEKQVLL
jgi:hypothetical protein